MKKNNWEDTVSLYKRFYMKQSLVQNKRNLTSIRESAEVNNLHPEVLFGIISLEQLNRGSFLSVTIERLCVFFFPILIEVKDMSIGIGQVKLSTAKQILNLNDSKKVQRLLMKNEINIDISAKYIKQHDTEVISKIVSYYLFGREEHKINREYSIYLNLLNWSIENQIFLKTLRNHDMKTYKE